MLLGPRALKSLGNIEKTQSRIMCAIYNGDPSITIVSCYLPNNTREETDITTFDDELSSLACYIPKHNILIINGDMNAQIGKDENNKFGLYNQTNRNGKYLINLSLENSLSCLNTKFQK